MIKPHGDATRNEVANTLSTLPIPLFSMRCYRFVVLVSDRHVSLLCSAMRVCRESYDIIYEDRIHILIDLAGYTKGVRSEVFALKPAALQVCVMWCCGRDAALSGADKIF